MGFTGNGFGVSLWDDENFQMDYDDDCNNREYTKNIEVSK